MPNLLALETSGRLCSVALSLGDQVVEEQRVAERDHAQLILPMIRDLMQAQGVTWSDLEGFVFGRGPGGFTGVRIATGVVQGLAFAHQKPVLPVSTLHALVYQAQALYPAMHSAWVAVDARMQEVYCVRYVKTQAGWQALGPERVMPLEQWLRDEGVMDECDYALGNGWLAYPQACTEALSRAIRAPEALALEVSARGLLRVAQEHPLSCAAWVSAQQALPVYLRDQVAQTMEQRQALKK
jgi:tRNA threonylcarbamoyladenosine biosynthesis protein TsaB